MILAFSGEAKEQDFPYGINELESCFDVYGKLKVHANLRLYLHALERKRIYAIAFSPEESEGYDIPENIAQKLTLSNEIAGGFHLCPVMQEGIDSSIYRIDG